LRGLPTPSCQEVRDVALPVLQHRIIANYNASGEGIDAVKIVERLLEQVKEASYK
jgi:MoxR-like ATPase